MDLYDFYINADLFLWVLLRITAFFFVCPLFGRKEIPAITKIGLSIVLSYILILSGQVQIGYHPVGQGEYFLICMIETLRGFITGYISSVIFSIFSNAGRLIDTAIGFQMAEIYDPLYGTKTSVSANVLNLAAFVVFLSLNGDLHMIKILADSYATCPIGAKFDIALLSDIIISAFAFSFLISLKLVLPIFIITLLTEAIMGIMLKFIPQINIFVVGIPLKIIIGLFALFYLIIPLSKTFNNIFESVYYFARSVSGTGV